MQPVSAQEQGRGDHGTLRRPSGGWPRGSWEPAQLHCHAGHFSESVTAFPEMPKGEKMLASVHPRSPSTLGVWRKVSNPETGRGLLPSPPRPIHGATTCLARLSTPCLTSCFLKSTRASLKLLDPVWILRCIQPNPPLKTRPALQAITELLWNHGSALRPPGQHIPWSQTAARPP